MFRSRVWAHRWEAKNKTPKLNKSTQLKSTRVGCWDQPFFLRFAFHPFLLFCNVYLLTLMFHSLLLQRCILFCSIRSYLSLQILILIFLQVPRFHNFLFFFIFFVVVFSAVLFNTVRFFFFFFSSRQLFPTLQFALILILRTSYFTFFIFHSSFLPIFIVTLHSSQLSLFLHSFLFFNFYTFPLRHFPFFISLYLSFPGKCVSW